MQIFPVWFYWLVLVLAIGLSFIYITRLWVTNRTRNPFPKGTDKYAVFEYGRSQDTLPAVRRKNKQYLLLYVGVTLITIVRLVLLYSHTG